MEYTAFLAWYRGSAHGIEVSVRSPLAADDAVAAMRAATVSRWAALNRRADLFDLFSRSPRPYVVVGTVARENVRLSAYDGFANSWKPTFHGRVLARPKGCVVSGEIRLPRGTQLFMVVWLSFVLLWSLGVEVAAVVALVTAHWSQLLRALFFLLSGPIVLAGGLFVRNMGIRFARRDATNLVSWLNVQLQSTEWAGDQTAAPPATPSL